MTINMGSRCYSKSSVIGGYKSAVTVIIEDHGHSAISTKSWCYHTHLLETASQASNLVESFYSISSASALIASS
jgi:hypothetical protein